MHAQLVHVWLSKKEQLLLNGKMLPVHAVLQMCT
jgi:hypothetical protein